MSFKAPVFTNKGKQLYASCLAGKNEIIFTNIKLGDGELMAQAIADLEDLINPVKTIVLNDKKLIGNDQVLIRAVFKNIDIDTGFYWREVGLYAQDPENPEDRSKDILFCYQNAGDTAEYIPSASSGLIDKILSMSLVVSDVNSVNVSFFSESYALKEDLDEQIALQAQNLDAHKKDANAHSNLAHYTDTNAHNEIFSQYVKKSGDTMSGALVMADSAQIFKNKDDQFLGLYGGSNFNNGAFFEICGKDHKEQSGNFNIYANNGTQSARLNGTPTGSLTWGEKNLVRSVNGVNADKKGNVQLGNIGAITGEIKWFAFNKAPNGYLVCNGANVSRKTYADLFAVIGTTYGVGDGSTTFALPGLINRFAQGSTTVGAYKSAGLPNITGTANLAINIGGTKASSLRSATDALQAVTEIKTITHNGSANDYVAYETLGLNLSKGNSIYGNSTTVQPPALTLLPCIKY